MKKTLMFLSTIFFLLLNPRNVFADCKIELNKAGPFYVGDVVNVQIGNFTYVNKAYEIKITQPSGNSSNTFFSNGSSYKYIFAWSFTKEGSYHISILQQQSGGISLEECNYGLSVTGPASLTTQEISNPVGWLPFVNPGFGPPARLGINFFTNNFAKFLMELLTFLVIILAFVFLLIGGIKRMISGGDKEGLAKAKSMITNAIIGLIIGMSALLILGIIGQYFGLNLIN